MIRLPAPLTSASHPLARQARALGRGPAERRREGLFLVEGPRGVAEALDAGAPLVWVLVSTTRAVDPAFDPLLRRALDAGVPVQPARQPLLERIAPSASSPGLLAACRLPPHSDDPAALWCTRGGAMLVVTCGVQDPGNLGTIARSAAAFGASGLIAAGGADPYNPRAVRASAGSVHTLPVARAPSAEEIAQHLSEHGFRAIAAAAHGGTDPGSLSFAGRVALLLGGEVAGLPREILDIADPVTIPTSGRVESLSVAAAAAILLAAAARQRR